MIFSKMSVFRMCLRKRKCVTLLAIFLVSAMLVYSFKGNTGTVRMTSLLRNGSGHQPCVHPKLPLWSDEVRAYLEPVGPIVCNEEQDWVYTRNGRFYITEDAEKKHGSIRCAVWAIVNTNDSVIYWKPIKDFQHGGKLLSDAFSVQCTGEDGAKYNNVHPCIRPTTPSKSNNNNVSDKYNIFIYGFDSMSRKMFERMLPKMHEFFTEDLGGILLDGYNVVGDGTTNALMALLAGQIETEIPEVRRGKPGARYVDEAVTFIWKRYQRQGYVTQWGEDMAHVGTFQFRLLGFKEQPVDHYMRAFQLFVRNNFNYHKPLCLGSRPRHLVFLDWLKEGLETNRGRNFFTFGFFSEYSHENNNPVRLSESDNIEFLNYMKEKGHLKNTILILMSDHGIRYGSLRETEQGKLEERMPYFGILFPESFQKRYPEKIAAFKTNTKRLATPYDIHESLLEILDEPAASDRLNSGEYRGMSLFHEIPKYRTCESAGIPPHWCACMLSNPVPATDSSVKSAAESVVTLINDLLIPHTELCDSVKLTKITTATRLENNEDVLKFKKTLDLDGRVPDLSDDMKSKEVKYQVTFVTSPRDAIYEATVQRNVETGMFTANELHISRLNRYGDAPNCIADQHPELRPYCVCKNS